MKPLVINGVPAYKNAPISPDCLRSGFSRLLDALPHDNPEMYLLLRRDDREWLQQVEAGLWNRLKVVAVGDESGFAYGNASAAARVLQGEKPIPDGMGDPVDLRTAEELLCPDRKTVVVDCGNGRSITAAFDRTTTVGDIHAQCHCGDAKALCFGYPMNLLLTAEARERKVALTTDVILVIGKGDCVLDRMLGVAGQYLHECCGRCVLGYEGATQIHAILSDIAQKKGKSGDIDLLLELCETMRGQALCDIGMGLAGLVLSAIEYFRAELEGHITKKSCAAGVCRKYVTYHILPDRCAGCGDCLDECEDDAILGKKGFVHVIDPDECVQCGRCLRACPHDAIVTAGTVKPKCPKKPVPCKR